MYVSSDSQLLLLDYATPSQSIRFGLCVHYTVRKGTAQQPTHTQGEASYIVAVVSAFPLHRYTFAQYLSLEEDSPIKHEFLEGEIVAMVSGTPEHAALAMAFGRQLGNQLEGTRCRVFSSDLRVRVLATGLTIAPLGVEIDVTGLCAAASEPGG